MTSETFRKTPPPLTTMTTFALPPVRRRTLPSGIEMVIYDRCDAPVCYLSYVSGGGDSELPSPAYGPLISVLQREGTAEHDADYINNLLDFNGAWFKSAVHSHHSQESLRCLNTTLPQCLPVFREMIFGATFPDTPFKVRREALAKNIEVSLTDVDYLAACASDIQIKGPNHPGARTVMPDEVRQITPEMLREAFAATRSRGTLFVCGNVTPEIEQLVAETFSSPGLPTSQCNLDIRPFNPAPEGSVAFIEKPDALQSSVTLTIPGPARNHPDYIPLHIAVSALGGYFGSRLMLEIREKLGLTYGISASLLGNQDGSYIAIQADTDCNSAQRLCDEVAKELTRLSVQPPEGEELTRLKQSLLSSQAAILDSPFSIIDYHITALVSAIPHGYFEQKLQAIASLASSDIAETAARYLRPESLRTTIAGARPAAQ